MNKKNYILIIALIAGIFFSCSDDDKTPVINPAAENGSLTFVLNQTQYADFVYVLEEQNSSQSMDMLTCSQPDYGFTAAVTYHVQVSFKEDMSDFVELASTVQGENIDLNVKEVNKAIFDLYGGEMPNPSVASSVYVRLKAVISSATSTPLVSEPTVKPIYSNIVKLNVLPYFIENLTSFDQAKKLVPYYIIGYTDWDNSVGGLGGSVIPLSIVEGNVYNSDGQGIYSYTGYFESSKNFKLIRDLGAWGEQWGNADANGIDNPVHNDGGASDFEVPSDGYYTVTLNSITNEVTFDPKTITPKVYDNMGLVGEMTSWGESPDVAMTPYQDTNNHMWYAEYTFGADSDCKFRYNSDWSDSWGSPNFPVGIATPGGDNIKAKAGTYVIFFNDIDGTYTFIEK